VEEVAAIGWAQTRHRRTKPDETHQGMIKDVVTGALDSCGMTIRDIDVVISAGSDFLDGRGSSNCLTLDAMGAHFKEESKVAGDGLQAAIYAFMRIASGISSSALVVAYGKSSESSILEQTRAMAEPFYTRPLGIDALSAGALQCRVYLHHFSVDGAAPAGVVVKNRAAGARNRHAQLKSEVSLQAVMSSGEIVSPIRKLEVCPVTDGACAVVLASGPLARSLEVEAAWITGVGYDMDACGPGARVLHRADSARRAAGRAYEMAGVHNPPVELDVLEVSEYYAYQELMLYEALGLCDEGSGARLLESGATGPAGQIPVNPSGGALCANPVVATGLVRMAEAASQVSDRAGNMQVEGANRALAHAGGGMAMQTATCVVVEGKRRGGEL
jgi:acetyl-CoA C-acetyltransferase